MPIKPPHDTCSGRLGKTVHSKPGRGVMSRYEKLSADWIRGNIILSTVVCGTYFAGSDTILLFKLFCGVSGGGACLAMLKTTLRVGLIIIEA